MSAARYRIIQALALATLLAAPYGFAASESEPASFTATTITTTVQRPTAASDDVDTTRGSQAGVFSLLIPGLAWPLLGGMLVLAAVNGRKPSARLKMSARRWPW